MRIQVSILAHQYNTARDTTVHGKGGMSYEHAIRARHSPIRANIFEVRMYEVPTYASTHFIRHHVGVIHWSLTQREDRGGVEGAGRYTPTDHVMHLNAEALLTLAEKRLCSCASEDTRAMMQEIKDKVSLLDHILAKYMVPRCYWRGGLCDEPRNCGTQLIAIDPNVNPYLSPVQKNEK